MKRSSRTLSFVVHGKPVGVNQAYGRGKLHVSGKGLYMRSEGRDYKERVRAAAILAVAEQGWLSPKDAQNVGVSITSWNTKHDVGAPEKLTCDALEGIIYLNDRVVTELHLYKKHDGGERRVDVTVKVLLPRIRT